MVLIRKMVHKEPNRKNIQEEVRKCTYSIFSEDGKKFLNLATYGSRKRKNTNASQTIQFDSDGIEELKQVLKKYDNTTI